ncbi:MAG TPA: short-chain dehydrogenase, partial [Shewanella frigidimarina]|nr:short-chain dehydrogenase [Shewanella frigidimarina]
MNNILKGKVILITGASSGIGRAMAQFFSKQGAQLVITGRNEVRLTETLNSLTSNNHQSLIADLDSVEGIEGLMDNVFNSVGVLDGLVHCAGIQKTLPLQALKEEQYDAIFSTNVKSAQFLTKFFRRKGRYNPEGSS